jgi:hypothetical protein
MRRSLAPSQILKPKEPKDIGKQTNGADKNTSDDGMVTIQRLPLFGSLFDKPTNVCQLPSKQRQQQAVSDTADANR